LKFAVFALIAVVSLVNGEEQAAPLIQEIETEEIFNSELQ
jgi:hypothetical protein